MIRFSYLKFLILMHPSGRAELGGFYLSALRDSAIVLFLSWRPEHGSETVREAGLSWAELRCVGLSLDELSWAELRCAGLSWDGLVLRGPERPRCALEQKVVASNVFRNENEHFQAVHQFSSFLWNQVSWAKLR